MKSRPFDDPRVGITTTVPSEVIFAAGLIPVDLNNLFMSCSDPGNMLEEAEQAGFPRNCCAWIKGIYSACRRHGIRRVVGVARGDCSNTVALMEILRSEGVDTVEFCYPVERSPELVASAIESFARRLGTTREAAEGWRRRLTPIRQLLSELDTLAWRTAQVSPAEAHLWMVSSSDFRGTPDGFERDLMAFLSVARARSAPAPCLPITLAGVPPIKVDLLERLERLGVRIAYDEMAFEFTMARNALRPLEYIYSNYVYPYDVEHRLATLAGESARRGSCGLIHYVQSFCYRQMQDRLLRERIPVPVLTLECDRPGTMDAGSVNRLEAFVEALHACRGDL